MQDTYCQETDPILLTQKEIAYGITPVPKLSPLYIFADKRCYKRFPIFYKNKVHFVDTLFRRTFFWDTAVPCGSENSHIVYN